MTYLKPDSFVFHSKNPTEDMGRYEPGGYHPLVVGNIVVSSTSSSSYRILHKLGFGSNATAWLAETLNASHRYVALKVSTADRTPLAKKEANFLGKVTSPHISPLIDAFTLEGPNGLHSVIVIEVLVPLPSYLAFPRSSASRKRIAYGLVRAVADLHKSNYVHGDLHLDNVGISIPQIANQELDAMLYHLDYPKPTAVVPFDIKNATPSLPVYVMPPCNMGKTYNGIVDKEDEPDAKLFGFGNAHCIGEIPVPSQCAHKASSPENFLARTIEKIERPPAGPPSDVWALGAMIYELMCGSSLFEGVVNMALLDEMSIMAPYSLLHWDGWCTHPVDTDEWWNKKRDQLKSHCLNDVDVDSLVRLLRRIFVLDPLKRPSVVEIGQDDWFREQL